MVTSIDKNTALVLIDFQKGIVSLPLAHPMDVVLKNAAKLVAAFHKAALPVIVVNVNPGTAAWTTSRKDSNPAPSAPKKEEWFEITPEIKTLPTDIFITKHTWSAFFETTLNDDLKKRNVTGIVLAGISTSIGVEGTARVASELGYNITFAQDAVTDMFVEAHNNSLKYIFPRLGEVDTADNIIGKL